MTQYLVMITILENGGFRSSNWIVDQREVPTRREMFNAVCSYLGVDPRSAVVTFFYAEPNTLGGTA